MKTFLGFLQWLSLSLAMAWSIGIPLHLSIITFNEQSYLQASVLFLLGLLPAGTAIAFVLRYQKEIYGE